MVGCVPGDGEMAPGDFPGGEKGAGHRNLSKKFGAKTL